MIIEKMTEIEALIEKKAGYSMNSKAFIDTSEDILEQGDELEKMRNIVNETRKKLS